jgi:Leucine-rich repeat (LRR) protein
MDRFTLRAIYKGKEIQIEPSQLKIIDNKGLKVSLEDLYTKYNQILENEDKIIADNKQILEELALMREQVEDIKTFNMEN